MVSDMGPGIMSGRGFSASSDVSSIRRHIARTERLLIRSKTFVHPFKPAAIGDFRRTNRRISSNVG